MNDADPRPSARLWLAVAVAALVGCVAVLVAFEVGLRVWRGNEFFYPHHRNVTRLLYPSEGVTPGVAGVSRFTTNSYGTRGPELQGERVRILTIGGSTTACTVLDDSETWPQRLMDLLTATTPGGVWVTNSGIDGKNSDHHVAHAIHLLPNLPRLDYVAVYAGLNDVGAWLYQSDFDPEFLEKPANWDSRVGEAFRVSSYTPASYPAYKRLHLWKMASEVKAAFQSWRARSEMRDAGVIVQDAELRWIDEERKARAERQERFVAQAKMETLPLAVASYRRNLEAIADNVRAAGAEPIFIAQALSGHLADEEADEDFWMGAMDGGESYVHQQQILQLVARFNQEMAAVARERDALFIDLPALLRNEEHIYYDSVHFNEHGAEVVAARIADALAAAGMP